MRLRQQEDRRWEILSTPIGGLSLLQREGEQRGNAFGLG